ncbi:NAD(+)/NADH kinase domain protein [Leptospira fainei serovar Hurstbridge str. BUT 6]|uniref:NAD(+)/NADH kinase domain protein n=1 Tax=Leptospira fainei serovar Hurstbridge str. BUT 6 TaxID=1193011 RepID=S3VYE8_9LEPT|nr:NAD(+)/NADH kinase [Leptospira fainei]EPG73152.1 NAD(+)/NADH kinase domain protein [Leptospira fainei serovar Hurstbridge str. BUT 6]
MSFDRVVIITRQTRLEESIKRFNTKAQASFYVTKRGQSFSDYELEDDNYHFARDLVVRSIEPGIKFHILDRSFLPNYLFGAGDLVVTLGQDGLVVNTAKYLNGQPILAFNPDPDRFDGILLPFLPNQAPEVMKSVFTRKIATQKISMAEARLTDGQKLYAFNDLFIGAKSHTSARYTLQYKNKSERQISSGIIVSTPAGSTGWMSSLFNMASGISAFAGNKKVKVPERIPWQERKLMFMVREPFRSKWSGADLVAGIIQQGQDIILESHMPENGTIFSDGMESDFLEFNSGATAKIRIAEKVTELIMEVK